MALLYTDPRFLEHRTGQHPESPERLRYLSEYLAKTDLLTKFVKPEVLPATREQLERIHTKNHVAEIEQFAADGGGQIETDTTMSARSFEVACLAAGTGISAVEKVLAGEAKRAVCLVRPPGHHALPTHPMGFCLFNNVAIAAAHARTKGIERVLIVDWDVHHGNGTQDIFYRDGNVFFLSVHRYPFYPGTGAANETGEGAGVGTIFNLPLRFGIRRSEFISAFESLLEDAVKKAKPELVLLSAGFDAHAADPVGSLGLETEDYEPLTSLVLDIADEYAKGRCISFLEGGYNVAKLAESIECHLQTVLKREKTKS
ncbi:MAG: histone deacetylase [Planctomycetaceae bacterium]